MSKENKKTVEAYEKTAHIYLSKTLEHDKCEPDKVKKKREDLEELIKISFSSLPKNSKIFEIGSGDGLNAKFIKELGYDVTASDIADDFIKAIQTHGLKAIKFNVLEDNFPETYFAIFCWRVFVHFTKEDALKVIKKVYNSLETNGIFVFNAMNRENKIVNDEWVDFEGIFHMGIERYYNYFNKEDLDKIIEESNFNILDFHTEGGKDNNKWLVYTLKK